MRKIGQFLFLIVALSILTGCVSLEKTLRLTQEIGGDGSLHIETPLGSADVTLKNARQENGMFKADELDLEVIGRWVGRIRIEATNYSRPVID